MAANDLWGSLGYTTPTQTEAATPAAPSSPDEIRAKVRAKASELGLDPDMAERQAKQESGFNPRATSKKGAKGVMQLMDDTGKQYGVTDPYDVDQNIDAGLRHYAGLKKKYGDDAKALAAYNAGETAVDKAGGIPNYPETKAYVKAILGDSAASGDLWASLGYDPKTAPEVETATLTAAPGKPAQTELSAPAAPSGPLKADEGLGFLKGAYTPVNNASHWMEGGLRKLTGGDLSGLENAGAQLRKVLPEGLTSFIDNPQSYFDAQAAKGKKPGALGEVGGNVAMGLPLMAVTKNPFLLGGAGAAMNTKNPDDTGAVATDFLSGAALGKLAQVGLDKVGAAVGPKIGAGLQKLLGNAPVPAVKAAKGMELETLQAAKDAAYAKVDASGFKFPKADVGAVAKNIVKAIKDDGGPTLYPDATKMAQRIKTLAAKGDLPLTQLEKLRGQIWDQVMYPGSKEFKQGKMMRAKLDELIDAAKEPSIRAARDLNTRYMKVKDVVDRLGSADLRASSTYAGGNLENAIRQNLRPLIDPRSPQRMRNLTDAETKALERVVKGSGLQNATRLTGKVLDPRGLLGATAQTIFGLPTGGMSAASIPAGVAATELGKVMTRRSVERLLGLMAAGGRQAPQVPAGAGKLLNRLVTGGAAMAAGGVAPKQQPDKANAR